MLLRLAHALGPILQPLALSIEPPDYQMSPGYDVERRNVKSNKRRRCSYTLQIDDCNCKQWKWEPNDANSYSKILNDDLQSGLMETMSTAHVA